MAFDLTNLKNKAAKNELPLSGTGAGEGGGIKVGAGKFICKIETAEIKAGFKNPEARNLVFKLEVVKTIDSESLVPEVGGKFNWYFTSSPANEEQAERLVGDLLKIAEIAKVSAKDVLDDADTMLDIYLNVVTLLAKPINKGKMPLLPVGRWKQTKTEYFNNYIVQDAVGDEDSSTGETKAYDDSQEEMPF